MESTVSSKYQVVIPKAARRKLGLKPGQKLLVQKVSDSEITFSMPLTTRAFYDKYAGSIKTSAWNKAGLDASEWLRQQRDADR